uniref:C2H2-type domain-containing protein n=1 Tax=Takifugu rubripes TaxID=31033 RepID=A0A3B5K3G8_TAKRU
MQSPRQSNSQPSPVTTATTEKELDSESAHKEPDAQQEEIKSPSAAETEAAVAQHGGGTLPETHGGVAGTQTASKCDGRPPTQPSDQTDKEELGSDLKPSATIEDKYYVPSKKAMVDPLKMDMSKPAGIPLTTSQLSLQCIECHIIFSDHKSKERHLKASHPAEYEQCILRNALFACYVCDRHFTNSTELMAHQKAHVEKKPFKCPICGQAFNKSSELTSHKKSHFGSDGYACTDCGKLCKTMTLLKYHRRTHTGEKPYICKECGQRFTMPKTLQKHVMSHLEGAEENGENSKAKLKNTDGVVIKYLCFLCNATFKTTKTRLHHMKTKHNMVPARTSKAIHTGQQFKESTPIITPISISEPALLQVEPNGPLQKVDANIDTEQICRLIESLGNVQKVNQVVILGQVPPHAAPLEVQQISQLAEPVHLNPPQMDVVGLKLPESKTDELDLSNNTCDPMEQTIILEPITPDGQLLNPPFAEVGCSITAGGNIGLNNSEPLANSCDPMEQTIILEPITPDGQLENCFPGEVPGELPFADSEQTERGVVPQILEQTGTGANQPDRFPDNLEQTVILELTPAVIPSEQSHTEPQHDIPLSVFVASSEPEKIPAERTGPSSPSRPHTVELEQQQPPTCSSAAQTQDEHDADPKEGTESQLQKVKPDHIQPSQDGARSQEKNDQEAVKKVSTEQVEDLPKSEEPSAKESLVAQVETKEASQVLLNTMSAQELVKVRKRKPSRAYFFQEYMQELVGSIYKDDLQIKAKPAKRQRTEKAHLVVKFGPPSKEKKNREKKSPQQRKRSQGDAIMGNTSTANLSGKKGASQKRGRKGKGNKNTRHLVSTPKKKSSPPSHDSQQIKDVRKNKMKRQKEVIAEGATHIEERAPVESPKFKKTKKAKIMQKVPPKSAKEGKRKKKRAEETEDMRTASADVTQDALRLLKGHKQPQLRVYKLDTSKASGHATSVLKARKWADGAKKNQKALSLLSSLKVPRPPPEALPSKTKTTRKRKASSKVEMEGVITSSSNRALECHDCGERFSEVASLQKHKGTVHVLESPGLTYTNGNIFEGVTSSDFYNLPKRDRMVIGVMNTATGWDTEPELGEAALEDREPGVSFPALIPSPSLPVPPSDVAMMDEDKGASKLGATVRPPSDQNCETTQSSGNDDPTMAVGNKRVAEEGVCDTADEDVKEDLMLEVDLVTVGEQSEKDDLPSPVVPGGQTKATRTCDGGRKSATLVSDESEKSVSLQTCSAHQMEIKEEEEEICGQSKKVARHRELNRDGLKGGGTGHRTVAASTKGGAVDATQSEKEEQECEVVYEQHTIASDSEMNDENEAAIKNSELGPVAEVEAHKSSASLPPVPAALEESREEPVALGLKPRNTGVEEALNERGDDHGREQSPAVMLEELPTSRQARTSKDQSPMTTKSKPRQVIVEHVDLGQDCPLTPDFHTSTCIFYPVKEEEREVLLGPSHTSSRTEKSINLLQTEHCATSGELSSSQQQTPSAETTTREPIDFFSVYFGQETWEEIANCTVKISNIPKPVTAREVAQFVGIHIAMGTLKFPSPKLYWEELTKVPLVAEAMPLLRFLELSRILKLAYPPPEVQCDARSESDLHNVQHKTLLTGKKTLSHHKAGQLQRDPGNDLNCSKTQTDPLWKVQPLLRRFKAGCGSLRQDGDFAVDQYPLPLTGKTHKKPSLCCTTLVGFGGFLLHLDIKLGSSSKEDAVEKMVPSGSTVFLCKQELSTPAMLERLLLAGVHGAGRVGGARGQIGDEFVSSDGKLMLRRSDCGFILSTVGSSQRDVASLTDDFEKAQMSAHLNRDLQSLYTTPLTASAPACWPQAVLWYLTDLALINSWLLYREGHTVTSAPLSLMAFRLEVSKALILSSGSDALDSVPSQPLTESTRATREKSNPDLVEESPLPDVTTRYDGLEHWPEQLGEGEGGRCRFRDCQRTSRVLCLKCCVFLCISRSSNCFLKFHNQESLGKG